MNTLSFLIAFLPLLLLVLALCLGRYPGEVAIGKLRRLAESLHVRAFGSPAPVVRLSGFRPAMRGGLLIASSLAGRGPPFDR
ncbi:MAG: hypothetical protein ACSLFD_01585 [Solirubrobacterales bacterium]